MITANEVSDRIGSYRIVRKLGEGGMGAVYLAEHALLGRRAAIKVLLPRLSSQREIVQRFFHEAKAVTQIADPGIVQVFDFGHHQDGSAFIVMELLDGEPLDRRLERIGRIAPRDTLRLMRLLCTSLAAAHAKGIVHRDLKPENIYIVADPAVAGGERAKILDFGIAKLSSEEPGKMKTRTGLVMGTPVYMSPEQCRGAGTVDARSDIYSIGCVMMTMLTGRPPFEQEGAGELICAHMVDDPPLAASRMPGLPQMFDQVLQRCLAKSPDERFQSMSDLALTLAHAEQLFDAASSHTVFARGSGNIPPPGTTWLSHATTLSGAAAQSRPSVHLEERTSGRGRLVVLALAAAALAGGIVFVATRSAAGASEAMSIAPAITPIDAGTTITTTPVAVSVPASIPPAPSVVDAGVPEVPAPVETVAPPPPRVVHPPRNHVQRPPAPGDHDHVQPPAPDLPPDIDRGD